ncbi:MAG: tetratricopeptide repeat protein, partial [Cyclobacteriaceae bacterium]|nr:tetratricopeptide repeat protein [Cyclobacteriaceae bacterium HetDA_MAG_MS6]
RFHHGDRLPPIWRSSKYSRTMWFCSLLTFLSLLSLGQDNDRVQEMLDECDSLVGLDSLETVLSMIDQIPIDEASDYQKARIFLYKGWFEEQRRDYTQCLLHYHQSLNLLSLSGQKQAWMDITLNKNIGNICQNLQLFEESIHYYRRALKSTRYLSGEKQSFEESALLFNLSGSYHGMKKYELAVFNLEEALSIDSVNGFDTGSIKNRMGLVLGDMGQFDDAISLYEELIDDADSLSYSRIKAIHNQGRIFFRMKDYESALSNYFHALNLKLTFGGSFCSNANLFFSYHSIGQSLAFTNKCQEAIAFLRRASETYEFSEKSLEDLKAFKYLADCYSRIGLDDSTSYYQKEFQKAKNEYHRNQEELKAIRQHLVASDIIQVYESNRRELEKSKIEQYWLWIVAGVAVLLVVAVVLVIRFRMKRRDAEVASEFQKILKS